MKNIKKYTLLGWMVLLGLGGTGTAKSVSPGAESGVFLPTPVDDYRFTTQWDSVESGQLILWQGFDHEWGRFILLKNTGRIPHRISRYHNYIATPQNAPDASATAYMAQSTGVDGNFMSPKTYYSTLKTDSLNVYNGSAQLEWIDNLTDEDHPVANNHFKEKLVLPTESRDQNSTVVLRGFALDIKCENASQPAGQSCNSDGAWPYFFRIALNGCLQDSTLQNPLDCQLTVDVNRAWTPNKGGFQLLPFINEIKPVNHRLRYTLTVYFSAVAADSNALQVIAGNSSSQAYSLQNVAPKMLVNHTMQAEPGIAYVSAITGFSFLLCAPDRLASHWSQLGSDTGHRGRYLAKTAFSITNPQFLADTSLMQTTAQQVLWSPPTVVDSHVETSISTQVLAVRSAAEAKAHIATGKLCINSTDQAPAYSRWKMCGSSNPLLHSRYGDAQSNDSVILEAP